MIFDARTLSLAIGLGNILFVLLASIYISQATSRHPALETWRWAKAVFGSGFLVNIANSFVPNLLPPVLGNDLLLAGGTLEVAAFCMLFGRTRWWRPLIIYVGIALVTLQILAWNEVSQNARLVAFSLLGALPRTASALVLLDKKVRNRMTVLIAIPELMFASALLVRGIYGLFVDDLVRFAPQGVNYTIYILSYVTLIISGFGFLLLAKQQDDVKLQTTLGSLQKAESDQRELLAVASHEFRTPAAMIKSSLDSLRFIRHQIPDEVLTRLDNIRAASTRLMDLANTLIADDRLLAKSMSPVLESLDIGSLIIETTAAYSAEHRLDVRLPPASPRVSGDPALLRIALHNLIDNAFAHNAAATDPVSVELVVTDGFAAIYIGDTGPGIPDALKEKVFERHFSAHGELTKGIGLSIVRAVANSHHGNVQVEDNQPQGATLVLRLPLESSHPESE